MSPDNPVQDGSQERSRPLLDRRRNDMQPGAPTQSKAMMKQSLSDLFASAANGSPGQASAALENLRIQSEEMLQADTRFDSQAFSWLLGEGVELLGGALRRPLFGASAAAEVALQVAALCRVLLGAARDEKLKGFQNSDPLEHVLRHLQHAAPACLQLLNQWFSSLSLTEGREAKRRALAVTTAQLAEGAARCGGLVGCEAPLLRFLDGCRHHQQAAQAADPAPAEPAAAAPSSAVTAAQPAAAMPAAFSLARDPKHAAAAAAAAGGPEARACEVQDGWDAALCFAAIAVARLATGRGVIGSSGGSSGNSSSDTGSGSGGCSNIGSSEAGDAAFAASLAAAQALLTFRRHVRRKGFSHNTVIAEAIAAPLWYTVSSRPPQQQQQQQRHLQCIGNELQAAVTAFTTAASNEAAAAEYVAGAVGCDSGKGPGDRSCGLPTWLHLAELTAKMYELSGTVLAVVQPLSEIDHDTLASWPAWQPWSEAIASCLQQLAPLYVPAGQPAATESPVYGVAMTLLSPAQHVLQAATARGVAALQRPPLPALLPAIAAACGVSPTALGLERQQYAANRNRAAATAAKAVAAVADALETSPPSQAPPPAQLLRSACRTIVALLRMLNDAPDGSVWQQESTSGRPVEAGPQQAGYAEASREPGNMLPRLANLMITLLREGPPLVARELHALSAAEALVAGLALPPASQQDQRQQRQLAAFAMEAIWSVCMALEALFLRSAAERAALAAGGGFGSSWPAVVAAIRQAPPLEDEHRQHAIDISLQKIDDMLLDQQQETFGAGANADAAKASPARRRGTQKHKPAADLPERTVDSAEAAMRALLLEEEKAAVASARSKAAKPRCRQAAKSSAAASAASKADGTPAATCSTANPSASKPAGAVAAKTGASVIPGVAVLEAGAAGPAIPLPAPAWMLCPITQEVMRDPVLCQADGHTYERAAITAWLQQHGTSFVSGAPAQTDSLIPNHTLRSIIQAAGR